MLKTKKLNANFKVGQHVVCTWGLNKGKEFIIHAILNENYSCRAVDFDGKYYSYDDNTLELAKK